MEVIMRKKGTMKYVSFYVYSFWRSRGHQRPEDSERIEAKFIAYMEKEGWVKSDFWLQDEEQYKQETSK